MQIKRKQKVTDRLELQDENGEIKVVIDVDIDVDRMMNDINKSQNQIIRAQMDLSKVKNEITVQNYGVAILEMINVIFGTENAEKILNHYDNKYTEMLEDIMPYITEDIMPKIRKVADDRMKRMKEMHRRK